jgi:hypothetical protein
MVLLKFLVMTVVSAMALGWSGACHSQMYRPDRGSAFLDAPEGNLALSSAQIDALNAELDEDFRQLDAFAKRRGMNRLPDAAQLYGEWKLYGRFYLVNFQHKMEDADASTRFTWRRSGPRVGKARIFILLHRQF